MKEISQHSTVCFISLNPYACEQVRQQLMQYLGGYIQVKTWCLKDDNVDMEELNSDLYISSSMPVYNEVLKRLPPGKRVLVADRTLEIDSLDEILALPPGSEALVIGSWEETAIEKISLLREFGISKIQLYPYWQGCTDYPRHVWLAIDTGQHQLPPEIKKVINIGVRALNLSTFVELIIELGLPRKIINEISQRYIATIIDSAMRRIMIAEQGEKLKRRLQVILNTVDQAIIAIDESHQVVVFNPAAEKQLGIPAEAVIGENAGDLIPEIDFHTVFYTGENLVNSIRRIRNSYYVVNTIPIVDHINKVAGAVSTLKPINEVQELDTKVRRELKRKGNVAKYTFADIHGESRILKKSVELAKKFAGTDLTILIEGASGTGKELFAQAIHNYSPRRNAPFVAINFAALPDNLVESELFGYEEGAFTGAKRGGKAGLFEEAHTGTIFLDEIGDASLEVQKKLLRVLEEKEVRRIGSGTVTPINVRVIAATNQNLQQLVNQGKYREDLYYRLCTIQVRIPALKERKEDIPLLIHFFAQKLYQREIKLEPQVLNFLTNYAWPGNIRELQNVVNYLCGSTGPHEKITLNHLPSYLASNTACAGDGLSHSREGLQKEIANIVEEFIRRGSLEHLRWIMNEFQRQAIFNRSVGRNMLVKSLAQHHLHCPEHKVRRLLKCLELAGFITVGTTRQGSTLTPLGEELQRYLEEQGDDINYVKSPG